MGKSNKKLPLSIAVPVGIPVINAVKSVMGGGEMKDVAWHMFGMGSSGMNWDKAMEIGAPIVVGLIAHKTIGKLINRYVPKWSPVNF